MFYIHVFQWTVPVIGTDTMNLDNYHSINSQGCSFSFLNSPNDITQFETESTI